MGKLGWNIAASIGLIAFSQTASATADSRVPEVASVHRDAAPPDHSAYLLAQAGGPKESAKEPVTTPPLEFEATARPIVCGNFFAVRRDLDSRSAKSRTNRPGMRPEIYGG